MCILWKSRVFKGNTGLFSGERFGTSTLKKGWKAVEKIFLLKAKKFSPEKEFEKLWKRQAFFPKTAVELCKNFQKSL
ncbi:MAG TPA: hypothetical protein DEV98_00765 [Clostridiales bacterium]|nr:hypothetical protein [Clostridiales bacterium]